MSAIAAVVGVDEGVLMRRPPFFGLVVAGLLAVSACSNGGLGGSGLSTTGSPSMASSTQASATSQASTASRVPASVAAAAPSSASSGSIQPAPSSAATTPPSSVSPTPAADHLVAAPTAGLMADPPCPGVLCVTIAMAGDVLLHPQLISQARADAGDDTDSTVDGMDFFPMLSAQQKYVAGADIGICHLETPLADPDGPFENYPAFSVPPQVLPALTKTGFDACSTASNHTIDQGTTGLNRTLDDLDAAGILHDGSYRSQADTRVPVVINTPHGRVGFISVAYGFNGSEPDEPWQVNTIDIDAIKAKAHLAKAAGADLVVVAMHAGEEYDHTPNLEQKDTAKALLADPDIDLVYGHHAHVVQPMEKINGKWAIYGLGNDIAAQLGSAPGVQQGLLARVQFSRDAAGTWTTSDVGWVASYQDTGAPYRWCALTSTDTCGTGSGTALAETTQVVNRWGADTDGAHRLDS